MKCIVNAIRDFELRVATPVWSYVVNTIRRVSCRYLAVILQLTCRYAQQGSFIFPVGDRRSATSVLFDLQT